MQKKPIKILIFLFSVFCFLFFIFYLAQAQSVTIASVSPTTEGNCIKTDQGYISIGVTSSGVSRVDCFIDGVSCSYSCDNCRVGSYADGQHTITVTGTYTIDPWLGTTGTVSDSRIIIFDRNPPSVSLSVSPSTPDRVPGAKKLTGTVTISAPATDNPGCGIKEVKIELGKAEIDGAGNPKTCIEYGLMNLTPNPDTQAPYEWTWDTTRYQDDRYYCLKATAYDIAGHSKSAEIHVIINNKCDKDNDGFITKEKFDAGCKRVVCHPQDWLCQSTADCNDDPDLGGRYVRPYDTESARDYAEGLHSPKSFYGTICANGCPACDDGLDNDCDGNTDMADTNCFNTCDQDDDGYYNTKCLKEENWAQKGDCNDNEPNIHYQFKESFDNPECVKINCCNDVKDNDCDGLTDECDFAQDCDKDSDKYIAEKCSPEDKTKPLPAGFLGWGDCDDNDKNVYPSTKKETEYERGCDNRKDNNCDKIEDKKDADCIALCDRDGDGYFNYYRAGEKRHKAGELLHENENLKVCGDGITCGGKGCDCDDTRNNVNPGIRENTKALCQDTLDNDCDALFDDTDPDCRYVLHPEERGGLVPCGREGQPRCNLCFFFLLLQKVITFARNLAFIVAPLLIVICGIMFIVAAGNEELLRKAKQGITATVVGLCIILLAWVIITLVFKAVGQQQQGEPWYKIECPIE